MMTVHFNKRAKRKFGLGRREIWPRRVMPAGAAIGATSGRKFSLDPKKREDDDEDGDIGKIRT